MMGEELRSAATTFDKLAMKQSVGYQMSVGIEAVEDILGDLEQALE
jgi:O-acetylhomoserine/O-acetylserine sulfhydrylase-like pyridoxal-dependent enzyme